MNDKVLSSVIEHAMAHYVTRTTEMQGGRQVVRSSLSLPPRHVQDYLSYLVERGKTLDQAVNMIKASQQVAVRAPAQSGNKWTGIAAPALIFALLIACIVIRDMPLWPLLIAIAVVTGFMWLIWNPRNQVMNAVWEKERLQYEESILTGLPKLQEVAELPLSTLLRKHLLMQTLALTLVPALAFAGIGGYILYDGAVSAAYHKAMTVNGDLLGMSGSRGSLYTVYDQDEGRYVKAYLSSEMIAQEADDVRAVLVVDMRANLVGYYGNSWDSGAYQYVANIKLYDCKAGEYIGYSESVEGSDPPSTIRTNAGSKGHDAYGLKPSDDEIRTACERLIRRLD